MDVPATQSSSVKIGQPVQLVTQSTPPVKGTGTVVFISPYFGVSGTQNAPNTVLVKASFPNLTGTLKTGQYVRNRIVTASKRQLSVPVQAVMMQAQQPFVYKIFPLSVLLPKIKASPEILPAQKAMFESLPSTTPIVVQTLVRLGTLDQNRFPVISGLAAGDRVVVSNTALLRSFMPVKVAAASSTGASN
jgi:hypothetical protein